MLTSGHVRTFLTGRRGLGGARGEKPEASEPTANCRGVGGGAELESWIQSPRWDPPQCFPWAASVGALPGQQAAHSRAMPPPTPRPTVCGKGDASARPT